MRVAPRVSRSATGLEVDFRLATPTGLVYVFADNGPLPPVDRRERYVHSEGGGTCGYRGAKIDKPLHTLSPSQVVRV
jgi:hypothetical protein